MAKTLFDQYMSDPANMRMFEQERAICEVTNLIENVMARHNVTRAELAAKLGKSESWVTQLLDGESHKIIRTVADVFAVLGYELHFSDKPTEPPAEGKQ